MAQGILSHATGKHNAGEATIIGDTTIDMGKMFNAINAEKKLNQDKLKTVKKQVDDLNDISYQGWSNDQAEITNDLNSYRDNYRTALKKGGENGINIDDQIMLQKERQKIADKTQMSLEDKKYYDDNVTLYAKDKGEKIIEGQETKYNDYYSQPLGERDRFTFDYKEEAPEPFEVGKITKRARLTKRSSNEIKGTGKTVSGVNYQSTVEEDVDETMKDGVVYDEVTRRIKESKRTGKSITGLPTIYDSVEEWKKAAPKEYYEWADANVNKGANLGSGVSYDGGGNSSLGLGGGATIEIGDEAVTSYDNVQLKDETYYAPSDKYKENPLTRKVPDETTRSNIASLYSRPISGNLTVVFPAGGDVNLDDGSINNKHAGTTKTKISSIDVFPTIKAEALQKFEQSPFLSKKALLNNPILNRVRNKITKLKLRKGTTMQLSKEDVKELRTVLGDRYDEFVGKGIYVLGSAANREGDKQKTENYTGARELTPDIEAITRAGFINKGIPASDVDAFFNELKSKAGISSGTSKKSNKTAINSGNVR